MNLKITHVVTGSIEENCWIIENKKNGELIVIDPGDDLEKILKEIEGKKVVWILLTHTHYDHLQALHELVKKTGAPVAVHESEATIVEQGECNPPTHILNLKPVPVTKKLIDSDVLSFGNEKIEVIHTPGHTQGSCCFLIGNDLFAGDTLFHENYGRTDLPGGNPAAMGKSLKKLKQLPSETIIHSGHGRDWTIGLAQSFNFSI